MIESLIESQARCFACASAGRFQGSSRSLLPVYPARASLEVTLGLEIIFASFREDKRARIVSHHGTVAFQFV